MRNQWDLLVRAKYKFIKYNNNSVVTDTILKVESYMKRNTTVLH